MGPSDIAMLCVLLVLILLSAFFSSAETALTTVNKNVFGNIYVSIGTFVITFVVLIFGEIIPKTVAGIHSENVALSYARVISILMFVLTPIIFIIDNFSKLILMILRVDTSSKSSHFTEDELRTIMDDLHP